MKIYVQLIENYLKQEIPTIILTIQKQRYIFNVPTCFQRFVKDHRQKFTKGSNIFFTKASTDTLAGLNGFMLTMVSEKLCQDTKLFVSNSLYNYLQDMRYKMGFKILPYSYSNLFTNETRTGVRYVQRVYELIQKQNYFTQIFMNSEKYINQNFPPEERNQSKKLLNENNQFFDGDVRIIPIQIQACKEKIISYLCIFNKLEGKVLPNKMKQLKIPPKLTSKLLAQGSLQLQDGRVVKAEQIKQPDSPSPNLLIFQYNSIQSVYKLINHPSFSAYIANKQNYTQCIIHIAQNPNDQNIIQSKQFAYLLSLFSDKVKHLVYNRNYRNKNYEISKDPLTKHLQIVSLVNKYFPNCMPDVVGQHYHYINGHLKQVKILQQLFPNNIMIAYKRCHQFVLAPKKSQGYSLIGQSLNQKQKQKKQFNVPQNIVNPSQMIYSIPEQYAGFKQLDPKVVFLGTGSMKPSKYRNVSSIYIQMTPNQSFLFDCGEGTYYQLFNHFSVEHIDEVLYKIRTVFNTHIHSDHNLGILDLIAQRNKLLRKKYYKKYQNEEQYQKLVENEKLFLIIPKNVLPWFDAYVRNIQNLLQGCQVLFVQSLLGEKLQLSNATLSKDDLKLKPRRSHSSQMKDQNQQSDPDQCDEANQEFQAYHNPILVQLLEKFASFQPHILNKFQNYLKSMGVSQFAPVHVDHCPQSFGVVVTHKTGIKISYSGDCRPSQQFAKLAHKSTLMIHQATFGDDLLNNAIQNMHSTVGQALDLAIQSESWKLALTHFSQRYVSSKQIVNPSLYKLNEKKRLYALTHSIVCFDHIRMRLSELPILAYQSRKICEMYPSDSQQ